MSTRAPLPPPNVALVHTTDPMTGLTVDDWYDYFFQTSRPSVVRLAYGATIASDASASGNFLIDATDATAFTINAPSNPVDGDLMTITLRNLTAGALGAVTLDPIFKTQAPFPSPAAGKNRSVTFVYVAQNDPTKPAAAWVEVSRIAADVSN